MILRFHHGWGFAANFWDEVVRLLPEWRTERDDRGYFGQAKTLESDEPHLAVAHSFGAMRVLLGGPARCLGLVAINGFDRFAARSGEPGIAPRVLDRMIARFDDAPDAVCGDFRRRCGSAAPFGPVAPAPLREDLVALRDLDLTNARPGYPILALQGAQDAILPPAMRDNAFAAAPHVMRMTHPTGGHLLPLTEPVHCAAAIRLLAEQAA